MSKTNLKNIPTTQVFTKAWYKTLQMSGDLVSAYVPFHNYLAKNNSLQDFRTSELTYSELYPVYMTVLPSYDGSVNLIINDDNNTPKLINSRFSVKEDNKFLIIDHIGNRDTNLYEEGQIDLQTKLYKSANKIIKIDLLSVEKGGKMPCGSYHFYFKLADNDDNETDFIGESGVVTCFIGDPTKPSSIRMGMVSEDSKKLIRFQLSNLDTSFDFIKVYYTRTTSDLTLIDVTTAHFISIKYPILDETTEVVITGYEGNEDIPIEQINPIFLYCDKVKTLALCLNMLFFGNIDKPTIDYEFFTRASLCFCPYIDSSTDDGYVGELNYTYADVSGSSSNEYYNPLNIYYKLGYFPTEYYRFGIVYILNDYTLSDVFNVRGVDFSKVTKGSNYKYEPSYSLLSMVNYNDAGLIENTSNFENIKGVVKFPNELVITDLGTFALAINFKFEDDSYKEWKSCFDILKTYIKGFFFVRQQRIPTFYALGMVIGKTLKNFGNLPVLKADSNYLIESFIKSTRMTFKTFTSSEETITTKSVTDDLNKLGGNRIVVDSSHVSNQALIVPEAVIRESLFASLFTSDDFKIEEYSNGVVDDTVGLELIYDNFTQTSVDLTTNPLLYSSKLTLIPDSLTITTDGTNYFSAKAGEEVSATKCVDVEYDYTQTSGNGVGEVNNTLTKSLSLVRGNFGTYVGLSTNLSKFGTIVNIRTSDYAPTTYTYCLNLYTLRSNIKDAYYAINDRLDILNFSQVSDVQIRCYRGDCYVNMFTHRLHRNFIDPELPLCDDIVDYLTWSNNFAVVQKTEFVNAFVSNEICTSFYRKWSVENGNICADISTFKEAPTALSTIADDITGNETWKEFGSLKINRSDVNAVPIGTWITFKVLSNTNLSLRDIDQSRPGEMSLFNRPRGFYPLYKMNKYSSGKLLDSSVINGAANVTLSKRHNFLVPDVPYIKNLFDTRIMYSDIAVTDAFKNGYRIFLGLNYRDYPKTYGTLVCLQEFAGDLIAVMEHGILRIAVNERAVAAAGTGGNAYINTDRVLPENPLVLSDTYGSIWLDSIYKTTNYIYGVDTTARKIWRTNGRQVEIISDFKVQKFLNDNINLTDSDKYPVVGLKNCKTHYNAFKHDVIFTFYCDKTNINGTKKEWALCYNEILEVFSTFYSWCPVFSSNINNIFFTFNKKNYPSTSYNKNTLTQAYIPILWKHGQAGTYQEIGTIKPTNWYDKTEYFEFEFVVNLATTLIQKIFNNLKIISNKTNPMEFEYEIVGESYDWFRYKFIIQWINDKVENGIFNTLETAYIYVLNNTLLTIINTYPDFPIGDFDISTQFKQLPFIKRQRLSISNRGAWEDNSTDVTLIYDDLLNEERIHTKLYGNDIRKLGRVRGNMLYLEDLWDIEIRPTNFKYAYLDRLGKLLFKILKSERIRDKYIKIRVRYSGEDLAIIQGLKTFYLYSYA